MKNALLILGFTASIFLMAFVSSKGEENKYEGKYGTEQVSLELKENHKFHYVHKPSNIDMEGVWKVHQNKVVLEASESNAAPLKWKIDKEYPCITARQKAEFIRLCLND